MEATGVSWKPVWRFLPDGGFELGLANTARVKNLPRRKIDVNDTTRSAYPMDLGDLHRFH